jgi:hypothetical protein
LTPEQKLIAAHAIISAIGFLLLLPAGAFIARFLRTFTTVWFKGHFAVQFFIAGPVIITGVALGISAVTQMDNMHLNDVHKKWGAAIFALYFVQCTLGYAIHKLKPKNSQRRPPQNYFHAVFGLLIIGLAFYQVRTGYTVEWPLKTGLAIPNAVHIVWYVWIVSFPSSISLDLRCYRDSSGKKENDWRRKIMPPSHQEYFEPDCYSPYHIPLCIHRSCNSYFSTLRHPMYLMPSLVTRRSRV